jgi:hypothetical protein
VSRGDGHDTIPRDFWVECVRVRMFYFSQVLEGRRPRRLGCQIEGSARAAARAGRECRDRAARAYDRAARAYDRAVDEVEFSVGERVLVWDDASALALWRTLRTHWLELYKVEEKLSPVCYILRAEGEERVARVHINRMRRWPSRAEENVRDPSAGMWPDSRRVLR